MFRSLIILLLFLLVSRHSYAEVLVRMEVQQDAAISNVDLRLFENIAPVTVDNFLKYVNKTTTNGGDYDNTFIQRSVTDFVIQSGGFSFDPTVNDGSFSYDPANNTYPGGLQPLPVDPPIQNEYKLLNVRGTIAMAKLSGDPNSATSQWFINLADNSSILGPSQNEGFTVFGEVLADGMTVVDQIAAQPIYNRTDIHSALGELPLVNYTSDPIQQQNLVRVNKMTELLSISDDIDFQAVLVNTSTQRDIVIKNTGSVAHTIGDVSTTDTLDLPFSVVGNTCSNTTLVQDAECVLTVQFSPQSENVFNETFNIELADLGLSYTFSMKGEGVLTPPAADITPSLDAVEFGDGQLIDLSNGDYQQIVVNFNNDGNLDLNITSMTMDGADAGDFEFFDNCVAASPIAPGDFCVLPINFKPTTVGNKSATMTVVSNDPDESPLVIPVTGTASVDTDGISESIEDAAPNGGDGNNDSILDSVQNTVASLPGLGNTYLTLVTYSGVRLSNIVLLSADQLVTPPDNVRFDLGALDFKADNIQPGGRVEIGLILPLSSTPVTYYMYGPTPDNTNPHWYEFLYDGTTGAQLIGRATITSPDGTNIERNLIKLVFTDGARGDADLSVNGVVIDTGAPVVTTSGTSSGSMSIWSLFYLAVILIMLKAGQRHSVRKTAGI